MNSEQDVTSSSPSSSSSSCVSSSTAPPVTPLVANGEAAEVSVRKEQKVDGKDGMGKYAVMVNNNGEQLLNREADALTFALDASAAPATVGGNMADQHGINELMTATTHTNGDAGDVSGRTDIMEVVVPVVEGNNRTGLQSLSGQRVLRYDVSVSSSVGWVVVCDK